MEKLPLVVRLKKELEDEYIQDLAGKVVTIVEWDDTDEPGILAYKITVDRPSNDPYMEGEFEEVILTDDIDEVLEYVELEPTLS